jgi:hypothetical protein
VIINEVHAMSSMKLPGGATATPFPSPPADFNPSEADDATLAKYGFPPRPRDPEGIRRWEKKMRRARTHVVPVFEYRPNVKHGPRKPLDISSNWSGSSLRGKGSRGVDGRWTVPNISDDVINISWNHHYSAWVGIDGDNGSSDVVQAGVHCWVQLVDPPNGRAVLHTYLWWEWYPEPEVAITNFPVNLGDTLSVSVGLQDATHALIYIENESSKQYTNFTVTPPSGTSSSASSAEWIVERPEVNGAVSALLDYGEIQMTGMAGLEHAGDGVSIDMQDESGKIISKSSFPNSSTVDCKYQSPLGKHEVSIKPKPPQSKLT